MDAKERGRRRFLKEGAALAGLAVGAMRFASGQTTESEKPEVLSRDLRAYGERSRFETAVRKPTEGRPWAVYVAARTTPLHESMGIITPASLHFSTSHGFDPPEIEPRQHRLLIHGMVDRPLIFTVEELRRLPSISRAHFIECAANGSPRHYSLTKSQPMIQAVYGETSCSIWTGIPLSLLLKEAGVQKGASWLIAEGADSIKHSKSIPLTKAMDDVLLAYGQNGEPVRPDQGYPLRMVVPGWEGVNNIKWLRRIEVVDRPYMSRTEVAAYTSIMPSLNGKARWFQFEMGPNSIITFPSDAHRLTSRGFYGITGLAWSGRGTVRRVEVSTDGGRTWNDAQLQDPVYRIAHTRFSFSWNWNGEESVLQSRCTDDLGGVQPKVAELAKVWGVNTEYFLTTSNSVPHFNVIQPWKVSNDGSIHNALYM